MFKAASFIIARTWKQPRYSSKGKWYIHSIEYCLSLKSNELSSHEKTWRNLKCTVLSERSQSKKATYCRITTVRRSGKCKTMERVQRSVVAMG